VPAARRCRPDAGEFFGGELPARAGEQCVAELHIFVDHAGDGRQRDLALDLRSVVEPAGHGLFEQLHRLVGCQRRIVHRDLLHDVAGLQKCLRPRISVSLGSAVRRPHPLRRSATATLAAKISAVSAISVVGPGSGSAYRAAGSDVGRSGCRRRTFTPPIGLGFPRAATRPARLPAPRGDAERSAASDGSPGLVRVVDPFRPCSATSRRPVRPAW
jgi:hypothetical protein